MPACAYIGADARGQIFPVCDDGESEAKTGGIRRRVDIAVYSTPRRAVDPGSGG